MKNLLKSIFIFLSAFVTVIIIRNCSDGEADYEEEESQSGANKQLMSWWWSRAYPEPGDINGKFYRGWLQAQAMRDSAYLQRQQKQAAPALFGGNWTAIGPSQNIGGRMLCIAIDPQDNNKLFAGSASGGIWKSVTGGTGANAWQPVHTGFPLLGVSSIIIHPSNSNIIYAGTGEVYRTDTSNIGFNVWKARGTYGIGILKSVNGGNTWTQVFNRNMPSLFGVQMLKFDPANSNIVYACTTDGLYRSIDAGANWNKLLDKIYVSDLAIHPSNRNLLVAAVGNLQNTDKGIYRSANGGNTWTKITSGLPAAFEGFTRLDNVSASPDMIIASIGRSAGTAQNELFRSNDFGQTWTVLSNSNHCQYQFWFAHDVAINPANTSQLIMGGVPLYNFTMPSTRTSVGGVHADIHDIEFDPVNGNNVYVACDGGIYKSTNRGSSFSMINGGLHAVQFYASLAVSPVNSNIIIGGLQDNGVVRYNGTGWTSVAGGDGGPCAFHPTNGSIAFASNDARRVMRSTNSGAGFSEVLSSWAFAADSRTGFMAPLAISASNPSIMYVASDNLHKSTNGGVSWTGNNYSGATSYIEARHKTGVALAVSPLNAGKLYVSTSPFAQHDNDGIGLHVNPPPNVLKSVNSGSSFTSIKANLPDRFVMDFGISSTNDDSIWVVLGGYGTSHVYLSGNGGLTWTNRGAGLPDVPHNAILLDPRDASVIYVGNDLGVYMSPDRGLTWHDYNSGLWDATLVVDLVASGDRLIAATHGKGVFVSDLFMVRLAFGSVTFTGQQKGNYNLLQWATSAEEEAMSFELERNMGRGWERIAIIPAANNAEGSAYEYEDDVRTLLENTAMYRLRMVEKSGHYTYSNVVTLRMQRLQNLIFTGRNPFAHELSIDLDLPAPQPVTLKLFDATGRLVASRSLQSQRGLNHLRLTNLSHLPRGGYVLEVGLREERKVFRVVRVIY